MPSDWLSELQALSEAIVSGGPLPERKPLTSRQRLDLALIEFRASVRELDKSSAVFDEHFGERVRPALTLIQGGRDA